MARKQQATKRKPRKSTSAPAKTPAKRRPRYTAPPPTLQEELLDMARSGARSLQGFIVFIAVLALIGGAAFGAWSMRPTPAYSSEALTYGSPFDVTFRLQNDNPWFALANLKITCVLDHVRASGLPPTSVVASDVKFPTDKASGLEPGEALTFRCPYRALIGHPVNDDPEIVKRSEIYFHTEYEMPGVPSLHLTHNSVHSVLDTRFLPPRWISKP
jgi:hypothetical protein